MAIRLPAEWEPQSGVMLTWPHAGTDWSAQLESVYPVFAQIGAAISHREPLLNVCQDDRHSARVRDLLRAAGADASALRFGMAPGNDVWARDHGPLGVLDEQGPVLHDFVFNGWGGKYASAADDAITRRIAARKVFGETRLRSHELVLEGGAIETDGTGTLLATRSSVIDENRNPGLDQQAIERSLGTLLGIDRFLWLDHGNISGDDTDGHVDTLARFCTPDTIVHATAPDGDADHPALAAMAAQLKDFRTADGTPYRLLPLPFPGVHVDPTGRRLPATYANFLVINGAVLLPVYGVAADREAEQVLRQAFPQRDIVPIDCRTIIRQNGSLHCLTMQFPAGITLDNGQEKPAA